ncbi:SmpA / OmlA family protein [Rickettsiales bacterium Ac37b]|nr:SmpA / OmlA family protein [Rickettsiales bacterium Ac37b]
MFNLFFILSQIRQKLLLIFVLAVMATACTKNILVHGFIFKSQDLAKLQKNVTSQNDVLEILGTPTTTSEFGNNTWYYLSSKYERIAFLNPKVIEKRVLLLKFNNHNILEDVEEYVLDQDDLVVFSDESTGVAGDDTRIFKQFIENIGRFNKKGPRNKGRP